MNYADLNIRFLLLWITIAFGTFIGGAQAQCTAEFSYQIDPFDQRRLSFIPTAGAGTTFTWDFADGSLSNQSNPTHVFAVDDTFEVCLTIEEISGGCMDTFCLDIIICDGCVWPGDANNSRIVNNKDVLAVGLAFNSVGPIRQNNPLVFEGIPVQDWVGSLGPSNLPGFTGTTVNINHADCDGNGVINRFDLAIIDSNYGALYNAPVVEPNFINTGLNNIPVFFDIVDDSVEAGEAVSIDIRLGTNLLPVPNVYGIAYEIEFDNYLIVDSTLSVTYANTELAPQDSIIHLTKKFFDRGSIETVITKIDQKGKGFEGILGRVDFVMEDNLAQKQLLSAYLHLNIKDVYLVDQIGTAIPINAIGDSIYVYQIVAGDPIIKEPGNFTISISPNPANNVVRLNTTGLEMQSVQLFNLLGQHTKTFNTTDHSAGLLDVTDIKAGAYVLVIKSNVGMHSHKLLIH